MRRLEIEYGEAIDVSDVGPQKEGRETPAVRTLDFRVGFAISERSLPDPQVRGIGAPVAADRVWLGSLTWKLAPLRAWSRPPSVWGETLMRLSLSSREGCN